MFVADEIASAEEDKSAAAEAAARREEEEELRQRNELDRRMEEAVADLERRMEALFIVYEIALEEEEKDVADTGTTKNREKDEEHRDFTEADAVK